MPIFAGFNLFLPLFPLGLSPLGTSVKQTNLVKETGDLNNSPKSKCYCWTAYTFYSATFVIIRDTVLAYLLYQIHSVTGERAGDRVYRI